MNIVYMLFFMTATTLFLIFSYLAFDYKSATDKRVHSYLMRFTGLFFIGVVLILFRNTIPDFFSIVLPNTLFVTALVYLYLVARKTQELETKWRSRYWIPIAVVFAGFCIYTYIDFNMNARLALHFAFCSVFYGASGWIFWSGAKKERYYLFDKLTGFVFLTISFVFFILSFIGGFSKLEAHLLSNSIWLLMPSNLFLTGVTLWILPFVLYRLKKT